MYIRGWKLLLYFAAFCSIYFLRLQSKLNLDLKDAQVVKLNIQLTSEPIIQDKHQLLKKGPFYIKAPLYPRFHYGDRLQVSGTVKKRVINKFFSQFWLINPEILLINNNNKDLGLFKGFLKNIYTFRDRLTGMMSRLLPEPHASLGIGILLGVKQAIPKDFYLALQQTGTLHIMVASGMNISLTAGSLSILLAHFLNKKKAVILSIFVIFLYCILAGFDPPIVRAGLMAFVLFLGVLLGREAKALYTLIIVGIIMMLFEPLLLFDVGFQLSFAATLGILVLGPRFKKAFKKLFLFKKFSFLKGDFVETLSAQIFTLPILVISFGHFNPLSIIPNLLILWLIPFLMFLLFLMVLAGLIFAPLAKFLSLFSYLVLHWFVLVVRFFGSFSFFDLKLPQVSWLFGLGYYLILLSLLFLKKVEK
jgi:competence protein ComEC